MFDRVPLAEEGQIVQQVGRVHRKLAAGRIKTEPGKSHPEESYLID